VQGGAGVEPAGECDADAFAGRHVLENLCHGLPIIVEAYNRPPRSRAGATALYEEHLR
jgi:hypothetical protein